MQAKDIRNAIDILLSNGKRLYDDACILQDKKRYHSSIVMHVLAYEEFAKAKFLGMKWLYDKPVTETEYYKLVDSGKAHNRKVILDSLSFREALSAPIEKVNARNQFNEYVGLHPFSKLDPAINLQLLDHSMKLYGKLHDLKMSMLYADYRNNQWQSPKRFNEKSLKDVCKFLRSDVIRVYHECRFNLFLKAEGLIGDSVTIDEVQRQKIINNADRKALYDLGTIHHSKAFLKLVNTVYSVIGSL